MKKISLSFVFLLIISFFVFSPEIQAVVGDVDGDGVADSSERSVCIARKADSPNIILGINRWMRGINGRWFTRISERPYLKIMASAPVDTYGCSCEQALRELSKTTGKNYPLMYRFGCTLDILKEWNQGVTKTETVTIPASKETNTYSQMILKSGVEYIMKAYGTATALDDGVNKVLFDAEFMSVNGEEPWSDGIGLTTIYDHPLFGGGSLGPDLLDILVNQPEGEYLGSNWSGDPAFHEYTLSVIGNGLPASFRVNDPDLSDNSGELKVDISEKVN